MPWFFDRAGPTSVSHNAAGRVAFQPELRCRHPEPLISRLNSPAYTCPCQRFACTLAGTDASLGVAVGRYSFGVELFHLLLQAGLSRRTPVVFPTARPACPYRIQR
jgi:hypothetical protein